MVGSIPTPASYMTGTIPKHGEPLTTAQAKKALAWFQARNGLQDWTIYLDIKDDPPAWVAEQRLTSFGVCEHSRGSKTAILWVSNRHCFAGSPPVDPLETLFHELMHVEAADVGGIQDDRLAIDYAFECHAEVYAWAYRKGMG